MNYNVGQQLGCFQLLHFCGTGTYGTVFIARSVVNGKKYALKIIPGNTSLSEREINGIKQYQTICAQSNLMQIYHTGKSNGVFYYTMDPADNLTEDDETYFPDTLHNRLQNTGRIKNSELFETALQLKQNIEILHAKGLLHRDIKPSNIIFVNGCALLGDVGLVTDKNNASLAGTTAFVSPQTAAGLRKFCPEDDFYALGKTIYSALTGYPPEKYPAFPRDLNLSECRKVILLYNQLIRGTTKIQSGKKKYLWFLVPLLSVIVCAVLLQKGLRDIPHLRKPALDIKAYQKKAAAYTNSSLPDEIFRKKLPHLRREKQRLQNKRIQAGMSAFRAPVSEADLENISKKMPGLNEPETYLRIKRRDEVFSAFDRKYQNNPVIQYFSISNWLQDELRRINALADTPGVENSDFAADWKTFQLKVSELKKITEYLLSKNF